MAVRSVDREGGIPRRILPNRRLHISRSKATERRRARRPPIHHNQSIFYHINICTLQVVLRRVVVLRLLSVVDGAPDFGQRERVKLVEDESLEENERSDWGREGNTQHFY